MKAFLAVNILMGVKTLPSYRGYWSPRTELRDNCISKVLSRERFLRLLGHLRVNDNAVMPARGSPNYNNL